jgi:hypothetical protein
MVDTRAYFTSASISFFESCLI